MAVGFGRHRWVEEAPESDAASGMEGGRESPPTEPARQPPRSEPPAEPGWDEWRPGERRILTSVLALVVFAAVGIGVAFGFISSSGGPYATSPGVTTVPAPSALVPGTGGPPDAKALAARTDPALVDINTVMSAEGLIGAGTGIVLSKTGIVLTNNHVIEEASSISATDVGNGKKYTATVLGYDRSGDIALLQLEGASPLAVAKLQAAPAASLGEAVIAVGNAQGAGGTPTATGGSVTGLDQAITAADAISGESEQLNGLIQTNAEIVPGDSGGALVNEKAAVIGMVTAGTQQFRFQTGSTEGYAIPTASALSIATQIEQRRSSPAVHVGATAMLGVLVAQSLGEQGAAVAGVVAGGPAGAAGLSRGDVITAIDGHRITSSDSLTTMLLGFRPGQAIKVTYTAEGASRTVKVRLGSGPPQ